MSDEEYHFKIDEQGQEGLELLDTYFNSSTQTFLKKAGINNSQCVLDIGCGSGAMTVWIAQQLNNGKVIAIENDKNQLNAAKRRAEEQNIKNIDFHLLSAYNIELLEDSIDFVYCRFVLHHLINPTQVIQSIYNILPSGGTYAAEEGLVNQAFTYPFSTAWGTERWHNDPKDHDTEGKDRDGNFGMKLYYILSQVGFNNLSAQLFQPLATTQEEKSLILMKLHAEKHHFINSGKTEADWQVHIDATNELIKNDAQVIAFYQSCQVRGHK